MRIKEMIFKRAGVVILAITLFLLMQDNVKYIMAQIVSKGNMVYGYIMQSEDKGVSGISIINYYMPVVGYVDSHYIENQYLDDPAYDYESQIEYIDIEHEVSMEEENQELQTETATQELSVVQDGQDDKESEGQNAENSHSTTANQQEDSKSVTSDVSILYSKNELLDFDNLLSKYYTVTSITELKEDKFNVAQALEQDMTLQGDNTQPQILIFHTHSQETFVDSVPGDTTTSIVGVGAYLAELLSSQYGYNVIHDTTVYDYVDGVLDRSKAYTYAEQGIQKILEKYPSIEVVLDIHRDGVNENVYLVTDVGGKPTAKIMFFNGISYTKINGDIEYLQNPYIQDNLAMSLQMYLLGSSKYPDLLRKLYINGYRYCLHFRAKSMLIEVGAQNNTLQEELNAMEPLAETLDRLFKGEKGYE